jgi:hypothetical protein
MSRTRNMVHGLSRRDWLRLSAAGGIGFSMSGWLELLADDAAQNPERRKSCILLWMNGGPSQTDTFDLKPGHANGGTFKPIDTSVPGIQISEHLPQLARWMEKMVLVRSMKTKEGDHSRGTYLMRTGQAPQGPIDYPSLGALVAKELAREEDELPSFVSVAPYRGVQPAAYGSGFLGPQFAPLFVGENRGNRINYDQALRVEDLRSALGVSRDEADARLDLLRSLEENFSAGRPGVATESHRTTYERAARLMRSPAAKAFDLEDEPEKLRDDYGRNLFGQGCLLARRLVERGVPFIEVTLGDLNNQGPGWDTHVQNFDTVKRLSQVLDPAWATLMADLKSRGLLDSTLIVWMGEFGRSPTINQNAGREHFPNAWTTVLAGGGLKGGQTVGRTSASGMAIEDRPVAVTDFLATICLALGIDYKKQNLSNVGRPIRIVDKAAKPIEEILA